MDTQTIDLIFAIVFLLVTFGYGWYLNNKFEKAGGWSGKPKTDKAK